MSDPINPGLGGAQTPGLTSGTPQTAPLPGPTEDTSTVRYGGDAGGVVRGNGATPASAVTVDHVVDAYRRYPGEQISFLTRVQVHAPVPGFTLQVQLPPGVEVETYRSDDRERVPLITQRTLTRDRERLLLPGADGEPFPVVVRDQSIELSTYRVPVVFWQVADAQEAGASMTFTTTVLVLPTPKPVSLRSTASVTVADDGERGPVSETVEFMVETKGSYLQYLPALFEQDEFMTRFLMLFESFWSPIDRQVQNIEQYFDPDMTPAVFLPWLASWFNLTLDDTWAEDQQRELLGLVMWLYRRRGTRVALHRYLEILTRHPVEIVERRARNLMLGKGARLGVGVAVGTGNRPHSFAVKLQLPPIHVSPGLDEEAAKREAARRESKRRTLIERLIQGEKPAHTTYHLEIVDAPEAAA
jgi:phage tail-like protein